jgi:hypothetical protein
MAFVKGSKAFIIGYSLGIGNQAKNTADINSIISSITYQIRGQGLTSQDFTFSGNSGNGITTSPPPPPPLLCLAAQLLMPLLVQTTMVPVATLAVTSTVWE